MVVNPTTPDDGSSNQPQSEKRLAHPQPARQPLMLVNSQKSGHLGKGCDKDCTHKSSFTFNKPEKNSISQQPLSIYRGRGRIRHID